MSLSLARTWVANTVGNPKACNAALELLDQAVAERAHATLIAGPRLTPNGKPYLGRWTGRELLVLEITEPQYASWGLDPRGLFEQLDAPRLPSEGPPADPIVSLSRPRLNGIGTHNGWARLSGNCPYTIDAPEISNIDRCGLHVDYFHPRLAHQVTDNWVAFRPIRSRGELCFFFNPIFSTRNPEVVHGTLILFLQLFTALDWHAKRGCQPVSNMTFGQVELQ